jgi:S-methylmethionine-dependent homocysteine/selenocysteine methylase
VDAYIGETLSCVEESLQVLDAVAELSQRGDTKRRPLLISYTLDSKGNFRDGQEITDGLRKFLDLAAKKENVICKSSKALFMMSLSPPLSSNI